jgi:hypothetical protein
MSVSDLNTQIDDVGRWLGATDAPHDVIATVERVSERVAALVSRCATAEADNLSRHRAYGTMHARALAAEARCVELERERDEAREDRKRAERLSVHALRGTKAAEAQVELLTRALRLVVEKNGCLCYDVPTLAPTDNPTSVECEACAALAAAPVEPRDHCKNCGEKPCVCSHQETWESTDRTIVGERAYDE